MTTETHERRYALTRIAAGDYLLPSNDAKTIYRLSRYTDGPSTGLEWPQDSLWRGDKSFWGVWRWPDINHPKTLEDVEDWSRWKMVASLLPTRADAIKEALRMR